MSVKSFENVVCQLEDKAFEYEVKGKLLEKCGWYTLACEAYGKRDGLLEAIKIIKPIQETE